jgi:hypothetical protein
VHKTSQTPCYDDVNIAVNSLTISICPVGDVDGNGSDAVYGHLSLDHNISGLQWRRVLGIHSRFGKLHSLIKGGESVH